LKARSHGTLDVAPETPVARQMAAMSHPDLLVIERALDSRTKRLKLEIAVDDARRAQSFFAHTSGSAGWRIAIVDSADDLNSESANALLKAIEEPPDKSIFLLVAHRPGRLIRTIRSRCILLPLTPLDTETTLSVLRGLPPEAVAAEDSAIRQAADLSSGSPGFALDLIDSRGAAAYAEFLKRRKLTPGACVEIGAMFTGRESAGDYAVFCDLLTGWIGGRARELGLEGQGEALARAHDEINSFLRQTDALNLDRRQTAVTALLTLETALKAS
jgi:DNA polymerase-3 subunit delta'